MHWLIFGFSVRSKIKGEGRAEDLLVWNVIVMILAEIYKSFKVLTCTYISSERHALHTVTHHHTAKIDCVALKYLVLYFISKPL